MGGLRTRSTLLLCTAALLVASPSAAGAATLTTSPYYALTDNDILICSVSNPSPRKEIEVAIAVLDRDGAVVLERVATVAPLGNTGLQQFGPLPVDGMKCRFSFRGGRHRVVGNLLAYSGTQYQAALEAR